MNRTMIRTVVWGTVALLLLTGVVAAQEGYKLSWWTVDGGGGTFSHGGDYLLGASIGQADAGLLEGEGYRLSGGFWAWAAGRYRLYLPVLVRNAS